MKEYERRFGTFTLKLVLVLVPLVGGLISARIAGDMMKGFGSMNRPPMAPAAWLFPVAWTVLYVMMGVALLLMVQSKSQYKVGAIALFTSQLLMNFIWSPVFFNMQEYWMALAIIVAMWLTEVITAIVAWFVDKRATLLLLPLILWTSFATYLNAGVAVLN